MKFILKNVFTLVTSITLFSSCSSTPKTTQVEKIDNTMKANKELVVNKNIKNDEIHFVGTPTKAKATNTVLSFDIAYTAKENREIVLEFKDKTTNKWIGGQKRKVNKGEGNINMKIKSNKGFIQGNNYQLSIAIRPQNSSWKETITSDKIKGFVIE